MTLEKNIAAYIKEHGINLSAMSRQTGIPYMSLYSSFMNAGRLREIRGGELIKVCKFLEVPPESFAEKE